MNQEELDLLFYMYLDYHNSLWSYIYYNKIGDAHTRLGGAFIWCETVQGHGFWSGINSSWKKLRSSL